MNNPSYSIAKSSDYGAAFSNKPSGKSGLTRNVIAVGIALALSACSSGGGSSSGGGTNTDNGDISTLQVITPKTIFSKPGVAGSGYVVINNPTATAVKNIHYSLTSAIGGVAGAEIESASAANCTIVESNSQCNIQITVPTGAVAGSFGISLDNDSSLLGKLSKSAKAAATVPTVGVEQAAYNSLSGADGITLSYYHTVINGTPYVLVSGLVASANAGTFNKVVLVDGNGNEIPNQELIGEANSTQGSTFNILLPGLSGNNISQTIKAQTQQNNTVVSTATASSTLTTTQNVGIAEMLPSAVYLTTTNPEQIITFLNTGDAVAQLQQLTANDPNIEVVFNSSSLASGTTATATLKLKNTAVSATSGNVTLTYNNSQIQTSTSGAVGQNVNPTPTPAPGPSPSPTPTPTPGPSPTPTPSPTPIPSPVPTPTPTPGPTPLLIFVTSSVYNGNLKGTAENGIAGADEKCQADADSRANDMPPIPAGTYKAMIVDGVNRIACLQGNCSSNAVGQTDWVLWPNTPYVNLQGESVFTTDNNGIFIFGQYQHAIDNNNFIWTGLMPDWIAIGAGATCNMWNNNEEYDDVLNPYSGTFGVSDDLTSTSIFAPEEYLSCNEYAALYCVQQ